MTLTIAQAADMLGAKAAAVYLGLPVRSVYELAACGQIPCYRYSPRRIRFAVSDLEEYKRCRYGSIPVSSAGASRSTVLSVVTEPDIRSCFRKAGIALAPKRLKDGKLLAFTRKQQG